ncbi:MAG: retention module-containing protein [Rhodocyclales bacterium]|nr:retention module-containing protein [Rhodocyclales bacterium]
MAKVPASASATHASSGSKANSVGTVKSTHGDVVAISASGGVCKLQPGDKVFPNDIIQTSEGGSVQIEFANGAVADLGRSDSLLLSNDIFSMDAILAASESELDDVASIQARIAGGADPTQVTDASAAGGDGSRDHEGLSFVEVKSTLGGVQSGFDTDGISVTRGSHGEKVVSGQAVTSGVQTGFNTDGIGSSGAGQNGTQGAVMQTQTAGAHAVTVAIAVTDPGTNNTSTTDHVTNVNTVQVTATESTAPPVVQVPGDTSPVTPPAGGTQTVPGAADPTTPPVVQVTVDNAPVTPGNGTVPLDEGTHTVAVTATDAAGNTASTSTTVTVDTVAPTPTITVTDPGTHGTPTDDHITNVNTVTVAATDPTTAASLQVTVDNGTPVTVTTGAAGTVTDPITLSEGTHTVGVTAIDAAGNASATVNTTVTVDTTTPTLSAVTITDPGTHGTSTTDFVTNGNITVAATATDGTTTATVQVTDNGTLVTPTANGTVTLAGDGTHTVGVTAIDAAGNASATVNTTVTVDTVAPTVQITSHHGTVTVTATDLTTAATLQVTVNGTAVTVAGNGQATVTDVLTLTGAGSHPVITATATDAAGNTSATVVSGTTSNEHTSQIESEKGGSGDTPHASSGESEGAGQASGGKSDSENKGGGETRASSSEAEHTAVSGGGDSNSTPVVHNETPTVISSHDSFTLDHDSGIHIDTESHPTVVAPVVTPAPKVETVHIEDVLSGVNSGNGTKGGELVFEKAAAEAKDDSKTSTVKVSVSESGGDHSEHSTTPVPVYVSTNSHSEAVDNLLNHNQVKHD